MGGGEGSAWLAAADAVTGQPRRSALREEDRVGCVVAYVRQGVGAETRRREGHQQSARIDAGEHLDKQRGGGGAARRRG